jgi:hypothetical protein
LLSDLDLIVHRRLATRDADDIWIDGPVRRRLRPVKRRLHARRGGVRGAGIRQ